jgi:iron complex outermembrane recepter protein
MKQHHWLLIGSAFVATPAAAQSAPSLPRTVHIDASKEIVVTAPYVRDLDILAGKSVLTGDELVEDIRPQIGETLTRQPGVSATSFAPGASRPVLRGFQGERVRVLTDGLGSLDISNTSTDHAVTIDPLTAERIEILRGPAVLLFGSQAIGGAVNVIDRRIPRGVPETGVHIDAIGTYGSATNERSGGGAFDLAVTPNIVLHADGTYRKTDDLRVPGFVLSPLLRARQIRIAQEEADEGHVEEADGALEFANRRGRVPNSATRTYTLGGGLALINEQGNLGFSVGYFDTRYGVPERPGAGHHDEDHGGEDKETGEIGDDRDHGDVTIAMQQWRADLRGEIIVAGGFLDRIRLRAGFADYQHTEFEGAEVGTIFNSQGYEGRLELVQADRGGWRGVTGFHGLTRKFSAVGEEAFVPPNVTSQYGLFTLQEFELGDFGIEAAGRFERTNVGSDRVLIGLDEDGPRIAVDRSFNAFSGAIGLFYAVAPEIKLGMNLSRAVRAPSAEELFSNGPHVATQAYEVGDPHFDTEKSWGLEIYARGTVGAVRFQLGGYATWFDDYIYAVDTGEVFEGEFELPIFQYLQADARYLGVEAEVAATLMKRDGFELEGKLVADYVHAELSNSGDPVPRIPPLRVLGGLSARMGNFGGHVEVEHVSSQGRVAAFETPTDSFTLVNASLSWRPFGRDNKTAIILSANNIFDVDARRHASFTKDFVPLPGRDIRLAARFSF